MGEILDISWKNGRAFFDSARHTCFPKKKGVKTSSRKRERVLKPRKGVSLGGFPGRRRKKEPAGKKTAARLVLKEAVSMSYSIFQ